jgi:hypothetical protein
MVVVQVAYLYQHFRWLLTSPTRHILRWESRFGGFGEAAMPLPGVILYFLSPKSYLYNHGDFVLYSKVYSSSLCAVTTMFGIRGGLSFATEQSLDAIHCSGLILTTVANSI